MSEESLESKKTHSRIPGLVIFYIIVVLTIAALVFTYMFHVAIITSMHNAGSQTASSSMASSSASGASSSGGVIGEIVVAGVTGLALGVALAMVYATDILIVIVGIISLIASIRNRGKDKIGIAYDIGIALSISLIVGAIINFLPIF